MPPPRRPQQRNFHLAPRRIRAWREVNELAGWELMRDGRWTVT